MGGRSARDSGSRRAAPTSAATPSGTLMRKIVRQPAPRMSRSTSAPPSTGPSTALSPITGPNRPNALPISSGGKTWRMIPKPCGIRSAANRPWTRRAAISVPVVGASPHSTDEAVKPATPIRNRRRRP